MISNWNCCSCCCEIHVQRDRACIQPKALSVLFRTCRAFWSATWHVPRAIVVCHKEHYPRINHGHPRTSHHVRGRHPIRLNYAFQKPGNNTRQH